MHNFLFHNDKGTIRDELFLLLFIVICLGLGILLCVVAPNTPNNWIISNVTVKVFGVICIIIGAMFVPGLIYRLFENDKNAKI